MPGNGSSIEADNKKDATDSMMSQPPGSPPVNGTDAGGREGGSGGEDTNYAAVAAAAAASAAATERKLVEVTERARDLEATISSLQKELGRSHDQVGLQAIFSLELQRFDKLIINYRS